MIRPALLWGPGPLPVSAAILGLVRHPRDRALGALIRLANDIVVHGAAGVIRDIPQNVQSELSRHRNV